MEKDSAPGISIAAPPLKDVLGKAGGAAGAMAGAAGAFAGGFFSKVKTGAAALGGLSQVGRTSAVSTPSDFPEPSPTMVDLPPLGTVPPEPISDTADSTADSAGKDVAPATEAINHFSIGDDEEDDFL